MDRRELFATTGIGALTMLGGCLGTLSGVTDDRDGTTNAPTTDEPTLHDLFVENHTPTTENARIVVTDQADETLIDGRFRLPDERGIEFEDVADWASTYTIELDVDGEDARTFEWETPRCGSESPGDGGSRNAAVRLQNPETDGVDARATLVVDNCDEIHSPSVAVGPADNFRIDD